MYFQLRFGIKLHSSTYSWIGLNAYNLPEPQSSYLLQRCSGIVYTQTLTQPRHTI